MNHDIQKRRFACRGATTLSAVPTLRDDPARAKYEALATRAQQFAEFAFSTRSVADAIRAVYISLLVRDG